MSESHSGCISVLMVEDDDGHARLLERELRRTGYEFALQRLAGGCELAGSLDAGNAPDAEISPEGVDLVVLDIRLPDVDGKELLRMLKNNPAWRHVPVVMISTTSLAEEIDECNALGCVDFLVKPASAATLRRLVDGVRALPGRSQQDRSGS